jgi:hypothetical protein
MIATRTVKFYLRLMPWIAANHKKEDAALVSTAGKN